jgi:uncharacterized lipoprotein YbaY
MQFTHRTIAFIAVALLLAGCTSGPNTADQSTTAEKTGTAVATTDVSGGSGTGTGVALPPDYTAVAIVQLGEATMPFKGTDGKFHVVYDLLLTNASVAPANLERIDVVDEASRATVIQSFSGKQLVDPDCDYGDCNRLRTLPSSPAPDTKIAAQESRAMLVHLSFDSLADAPKMVLHHAYLRAAANPGTTEPSTVDYLVTPVNISAGTARVISPPVMGTNWVAQNGCCDVGFPHVPSLSPLSGKLSNSQRLAIDWMRTNDDGEFVSGDKTKNESYLSYGQEIHAVADGTISSTLDTLEANTPGVLPASDPELRKQITVETVDGNHIVQDLGGGVWAMYAHLQKGSLLVKPGDQVKAGQVIAKLGNTGNSNAAHLHFQLMNDPSLIGADAVPYVLDSFSYAGFLNPELMLAADDYITGKFFADHLATEQPRTDELPMSGNIINFAG